jgi:hypothetical protein
MTLSQQPRIPIARKFGRSFERCDPLSPASIGNRDLGKVNIDCKFRLSESKWGVLGAAERSAGILYMDLTFDQPKDCKLSSATVLITVDGEDIAAESLREATTEAVGTVRSVLPALRITDSFGPKNLSGEQKTMQMKSTYRLTPNFNVLGNGAGGVGRDIEKINHFTGRWTFTGHIKPTKVHGRNGVTSMTYKTIKWELTENDLDLRVVHNKVVHTAFAFEHDQKPCYIRVEISGKLQRVRDRIRSTLRFPPARREDQGETIARIELGPSYKFKNRLDSIANGLARAMEMENFEAIPVELPEAIRPTFHEVAPVSDHTTVSSAQAPSMINSQETWPAHTLSEVGPSTTNSMLESSTRVTIEDQLLQDLARAHLVLPRPQFDNVSASVAQSTHSSVTVVDQDLQEGNLGQMISVKQSETSRWETGHDEKRTQSLQTTTNMLKSQNEVEAALATFVRLSKSPVMLFLIKLFATFLEIFGKKTEKAEPPH